MNRCLTNLFFFEWLQTSIIMVNAELMAELKASSHARLTLDTYAFHFERFEAWCRKQGYDEPDDKCVAAYLAGMFEDGYAPSTISTACAAIKHHADNNQRHSAVGSRAET